MITHSRRLQRVAVVAVAGLEALAPPRHGCGRRRRLAAASLFCDDGLRQTILPDLPLIATAVRTIRPIGPIAPIFVALGTFGPLTPVPVAIAAVLAVHVAIHAVATVMPVETVLSTVVTLIAMAMLIVAVAAMMLLLTIIVTLLTGLVEVTRLAHWLALGLGHLTHVRLALAALAELLALVLAKVVACIERIAGHHRTACHRQATGERITAALADLLLAETHDDAVVVLGVLHVILSQHGIAGRQRITRQRHVFFGDM